MQSYYNEQQKQTNKIRVYLKLYKEWLTKLILKKYHLRNDKSMQSSVYLHLITY